MAPDRASHTPLRRGGITVRTIRAGSSSTGQRPDIVASTTPSSGQRGSKRRKNARPSQRYRDKSSGASRPGENFYADPIVAHEFEKRVQEIYSSTDDLNESVRELPLRLLAKRDGPNFHLARLGDMCIKIAAQHFETKVLPLLKQEKGAQQHLAEAEQSSRAERGIFGVARETEEDDRDFVPDLNDEPPQRGQRQQQNHHRSKRRKGNQARKTRDEQAIQADIHDFNSSLMSILPVKARLVLQEELEEKNAQVLDFYTLSKYFISRSSVTASKQCRILANPETMSNAGVSALLRSLHAKDGSGGGDFSYGGGACPADSLGTLLLQAHTRLTSAQITPLLQRSSRLTSINLRGCISITSGAIKKLVVSAGEMLQFVNLNWTGVGLEGVEEVIRSCPNLQVLKVAHVQNLTESTVPAMMERISRATVDRGIIPLSKLRKLKLRGTQIGTIGVGSLLKHCGSNLHTLDISDTRFGGDGCIEILLVLLGVQQQSSFAEDEKGANEDPTKQTRPSLRKLNLSGLSLPAQQILKLPIRLLSSLEVFDFSRVHSLRVGGSMLQLGEGIHFALLSQILYRLSQTTRSATRENDRAGAAPDSHRYNQRRISLANRVEMHEFVSFFPTDEGEDYLQDTAQDSVHRVKCLDLSGTANTLEWIGAGVHGGQARVWGGCQELNLSNCGLPKDHEGFLQTPLYSGQLRRLNLTNTTISEEELDSIIEANPFLTGLNLTGCRGIPVKRRRNYFNTTG